MYVALSIFIIAFCLFIGLARRKTIVAICAGLLLIIAKAITLKEAFLAINWNVMGIFISTLIVTGIFVESRAPAYISEIIVDRARNTGWAILRICLLTGFISKMWQQY
jgi:Na+/H+ antiporter NhaD/arsenite permease-like protein